MSAEQTISERIRGEVSAAMDGFVHRKASRVWDHRGMMIGFQLSADDYRELRAHVTAALLAAGILQEVRAAWDEGYTSGHSNAMRRMSDEPNAPTTTNPYRADSIVQGRRDGGAT